MFHSTHGNIWQFQFTPLREGRRAAAAQSSAAVNISIHAPPRGATAWRVWMNYYPTFQFTPLREGRRVAIAGLLPVSGFQFTPLREGRL